MVRSYARSVKRKRAENMTYTTYWTHMTYTTYFHEFYMNLLELTFASYFYKLLLRRYFSFY